VLVCECVCVCARVCARGFENAAYSKHPTVWHTPLRPASATHPTEAPGAQHANVCVRHDTLRCKVPVVGIDGDLLALLPEASPAQPPGQRYVLCALLTTVRDLLNSPHKKPSSPSLPSRSCIEPRQVAQKQNGCAQQSELITAEASYEHTCDAQCHTHPLPRSGNHVELHFHAFRIQASLVPRHRRHLSSTRRRGAARWWQQPVPQSPTRMRAFP
jgi:hypothetical protein